MTAPPVPRSASTVPVIHPVRLALRVDGRTVGDVVTFVEETDPRQRPSRWPWRSPSVPTPPCTSTTAATSCSTTTPSPTLTRLATILETSAMPVTVHVAPALLAALRGTQPALADRFAAVLGKATILSAPHLPLDPSAAAAADQAALYTQWLAAGEDLFGGADLPGTTLRVGDRGHHRRSASRAGSCCATSAPACCC